MQATLKISFVLLSLMGLMACQSDKKGSAEVTLPEVVVKKADVAPYKGSYRFVGRLEATASTEISAKVSGFIVDRTFKEGEWVDAGKELFILDPEPFKAELAKVKAQLEAAEVKYRTTSRDYKRNKRLVKSGTISQQDFDRAEGQYLDAKANVTLAEAQVRAAELDLDYSTIAAPIAGRIGRKNVDVGDLVSPSTGALTTIKSLNPIQVSFGVDEKTFLAANRDRVEREQNGQEGKPMEVYIELSDGTEYPQPGKISFVDNHIDQNTGTIAIRADIPNEVELLIPGQYVKVIVRSPDPRDLVKIPQSALMKDQQGDYIFVLDNKHTVKRRNILLGDRVGTEVFIMNGLEQGEEVIVKGLQKVRPEVQAAPVSADSGEPTSSTTSDNA